MPATLTLISPETTEHLHPNNFKEKAQQERENVEETLPTISTISGNRLSSQGTAK